jgi:hypothetical protein
MAIIIDDMQIQVASISTAEGEQVDGIVIPVVIPLSEVQQAMDDFDAESGTHPLASQAKPLARPILEALEAYVAEHPDVVPTP